MPHIDTLSLPGRRYFYCSACSVCGKALYHGPLAADSLCSDEVFLPWVTQTDGQTHLNVIIVKAMLTMVMLTFVCIIHIQLLFIFDHPPPESFF